MLENFDVVKKVCPLVSLAKVLLCVIQGDKQAASKSEKRAETSECIFASKMRIITHFNTHILFKSCEILLPPCLINCFA